MIAVASAFRRTTEDVDRLLVLQQFLRACIEAKIEIIAYCFMPDHVHQLVKGICHDRWLRKDEEPRTIVRYIIENPVRAKLVEKAEDYPFTGSQRLTIAELKEWAYRY